MTSQIDSDIAQKVFGWTAKELKRGFVGHTSSVEQDLLPGTFHIYDGEGKFQRELIQVRKFDPYTGVEIPNYPWYDANLPKWSENLLLTWEVIDKMILKGSEFSLSAGVIEKQKQWCACFYGETAWAETAQMAICLAAIKALEKIK